LPQIPFATHFARTPKDQGDSPPVAKPEVLSPPVPLPVFVKTGAFARRLSLR